jgi:hypothetical protein
LTLSYYVTPARLLARFARSVKGATL